MFILDYRVSSHKVCSMYLCHSSLLKTFGFLRPLPKIHTPISICTDYGRRERKKPSLHGRKFIPTPKFLGTAKAYFVCLHWVSVVREYIYWNVEVKRYQFLPKWWVQAMQANFNILFQFQNFQRIWGLLKCWKSQPIHRIWKNIHI